MNVMRKYLFTLTILALVFVASTSADQGNSQGKKNGPPWMETVAKVEFHHVQGEFQAPVYVPNEAGMYRVAVYVSGESPDGSQSGSDIVVSFTEAGRERRVGTTPGGFGNSILDAGSGTATIRSEAHQPIQVRVMAGGASTYSVYAVVEKL